MPSRRTSNYTRASINRWINRGFSRLKLMELRSTFGFPQIRHNVDSRTTTTRHRRQRQQQHNRRWHWDKDPNFKWWELVLPISIDDQILIEKNRTNNSGLLDKAPLRLDCLPSIYTVHIYPIILLCCPDLLKPTTRWVIQKFTAG